MGALSRCTLLPRFVGTNIKTKKNKKQIKTKKKVIFIIFSVYLRFLYELFNKIAFLLRKNWVQLLGVWGKNVKQLFLFGGVLPFCLVYATKKTRSKNRNRWAWGWGAWRGVGVGVRGGWGCVGA